MSKHKTYLAGPMRGYPLYNFPLFDKVADLLRAQDYLVTNPADLDRQRGFDTADLPKDCDTSEVPKDFDLDATIRADIDAVMNCDSISLLPGWEKSQGANVEKAVAEWAGKTVYYVLFVSPDVVHLTTVLPTSQSTDKTRGVHPIRGKLDPAEALDQKASPCPDPTTPTKDAFLQTAMKGYRELFIKRLQHGDYGSAEEGVQPKPLFPEDATERKTYPVFTGLLDYFPHACAAVAHHSFIGNEQHNPGEPMHWAKEKSLGDGNQIVRHLMEGDLEAMVWRSLELLERKLTGLPPFAKDA